MGVPFFIFNNINSKDKGILVNNLPPISKAERKYEELEIPGRNGKLYIDENCYDTFVYTITCTLMPDSNIREISKWLNGTGKLILCTELDKIYDVLIKDQIDYEQTYRICNRFEVNFEVQPVAKSVLEKEKVDTKGMLLDENYFTTLAFVSVAENGERSFSFARKPGADTKIEKEEINVDILDKTTLFHVGSLSLTEQPARNTTHYAIRRAKEKGSIISYDPNYRASLWKDKKTAKEQMRSLIPYVDLMKISDEETELLTGKEKPEEAAKLLFEKGVKIVVVTLGSKGAYLYCKEGGLQIPGFVSKVADTNGAGDSFWGGFLYRISKSGKKPEEFTLNELKEYVRFGNAVASLCVEKKGAIPAMPTLMEVRERMGQ